MTGAELAQLLILTMSRWQQCADELTELDRAIGDGDLGLTVAAGAQAVAQALSAVEGSTTPTSVLTVAARSFASANPSTMAALGSIGLLAAARALREVEDVRRSDAAAALRAAADAIGERGGAKLGDKTLLDALYPSVDALEGAPGEGRSLLESMVVAAGAGVAQTTELVSQRGRAAWLGERTAGQPDGGATAYWRLLQAMNDSWEAVSS